MPNQNKIGKNTTSKFQSSFSKRLIQASGWILWIFALLLMLALISYNPYDPSFNTSSNQPPSNLLGYIGSHLSDILIQWVGIASFFPVLVFIAWGWRIIRFQYLKGIIIRFIAMIIAIPVMAALIVATILLFSGNKVPTLVIPPGLGGSIGYVIARTSLIAAQDTLGIMGKILIWVLSAIFCLLLIPLTMGLSKQEWKKIIGFFKKIFQFFYYTLLRKSKPAEPETDHYINNSYNVPPRTYNHSPFKSNPNILKEEQTYTPPAYQDSVRETTHAIQPYAKKQKPSSLAPDNTPIFNPEDDQEDAQNNYRPASQSLITKQETTVSTTVNKNEQPLRELTKPTESIENGDTRQPDKPYEKRETTPIKNKGIFSLLHKPLKEHFVSSNNASESDPPSFEEQSGNSWSFPSLSLLKPNLNHESNKPTPEMLHANARMLETILDDYGVKGTIGNILHGPVVTLYELEPAPGIRSARVIGLSDDIARSLSVISVRIATVPGRNIIGIEVPNNIREIVYFSELLNTENWYRNSARLCLALGKNIFGEPIYANLAKMPHLLIAGTTGSGKSVGVNAMILSLLYRLSPDECRLILIDPKMLELSVYEGIPHLLTPVVTDPHKALSALKWAVREMERRYRLMSQLGVRNIDGYNQRITNAKNQSKVMTRRIQTGFDPETGKPTFEEQQIPLEHFPYIVIVIDEMADLMMVAGKDIEAAVQRLAQMARAAGIHVIMATQRPSVDVITGTIKANFPTRISFQVISKFDSRTILGEQGAEQLLGQGDMLFMQAGGRIERIHGPFVSDEEVERVVQHLRTQGEPIYVEDVTVDPVEDNNGRSGGNNDELYNQAINLVLREGKASTSFIQRHLSIGYNRAAKIIEQMEKERIVSPANHVGKREILIKRSE